MTSTTPTRGCTAAAAASITAIALAVAPSTPALASASDSGPAQRVIVVMKQPAALSGPSAAGRRTQMNAMAAAERPALRAVSAAHGHIRARYSLIAGFAATLSPAGIAALQARADVAAVLPDRLERLPEQPATPLSAQHPAGPRPLPTSTGQVCPASASHPQLEPEALSLMRAASDDPKAPAADHYADGSGVRVGVVADAVDVDNADFRRPDGAPVVVDYQDFSGTGTAAPADAIEGMGDVSSIAAQGNKTFDLSAFGAVPAGCTVHVRGVAPGAEIVALKVTDGRTFYDSSVVEGIDYAVTVAHVDVLNESILLDPYPDTGMDAISLADQAAVAAGVVVTASSGDSGRGGTTGAPADSAAISRGVLDVGATTQLRLEQQQQGYYAPTAAVESGNLANLSSSGVPLTGRTVDVVAPGYRGWIDCTDDPARYLDCPTWSGTSVDGLSDFEGTSESAPLTAGVAALVIQRYRATHRGASPSPELVKQIIVNTADDLGAPGDEQGAGQVDALRAVQLAGAVAGGSGASNDLLTTPTQQTLTVVTGARATTTLRVSNPSSTIREVTLARRQTVLAGVSRQSVHYDYANNRFPTIPFTVPAHVSRIVVSWVFPGSAANYTEAELADSSGAFVNEANQLGTSNNLVLTAEHAQPGTWQFLPEIVDYSGPATLEVRFYRITSVRLETLRLQPRATARVPVVLCPRTTAGDHTMAITVADARGTVLTSVPVTVRALADVTHSPATLHGALSGGDGFGLWLAGADSYLVRVPRDARALHVSVSLAAGGQEVDGYLVSPDGDSLDQRSNLPPGATDPTTGGTDLELTTVQPQAGLWRVVLGVNGALAGDRASVAYAARVDTVEAPITASGLPTAASTRLPRGVAHPVTVHIANPTAQARAYIVDPRLDQQALVHLVGQQSLHIDATNPYPSATITVPPQTTQLTSTMTATGPVAATMAPFNFSFPGSNGDPEIYAASTDGRLHLQVTARELSNGGWYELPTGVGPYPATGTPAIDVSVQTTAQIRAFDSAITSATGDPWLASIGPRSAVTPVIVPAHGSADVAVTITPTAHVGHLVTGTLFVETWDAAHSVTGQVAALPYGYTPTATPPLRAN